MKEREGLIKVELSFEMNFQHIPTRESCSPSVWRLTPKKPEYDMPTIQQIDLFGRIAFRKFFKGVRNRTDDSSMIELDPGVSKAQLGTFLARVSRVMTPWMVRRAS